MNTFPTTFTDTYFLDSSTTSGAEQAALQSLAEKGFGIQLGLSTEDVPALQALSVQTSVLKYCPKDCTERFKDLPTIEKWLEKERLVFLLKEKSSGQLAGVAWTGPGTSSHIPGGKLTGGIRLSEDFQGQGLATPFLTVVLEHTKEKYSREQIWFECWQSNAGAVHIYQKLGFKIVETEPSQRLTPHGTFDPDTRIYMKLG
ncbi:GNAT family N-acetyltransferase [Candidatus Saccharibacteria bacterium]|nr:GNAT family N-acetyltransferase [Candidatus Saccharibacteria bacterium]